MALLHFVVRGTSKCSLNAKQGNGPMNNAIRSEKVESIMRKTAISRRSRVEAGIRDFVRNDVAYLRRPGTTVSTGENALEPNTEATVNKFNSLIQRVAGTSLAEI